MSVEVLERVHRLILMNGVVGLVSGEDYLVLLGAGRPSL
jgi:hypothetical protein